MVVGGRAAVHMKEKKKEEKKQKKKNDNNNDDDDGSGTKLSREDPGFCWFMTDRIRSGPVGLDLASRYDVIRGEGQAAASCAHWWWWWCCGLRGREWMR